MGSALLPHLRTAWHVDQAIVSEEERLVVCKFNMPLLDFAHANSSLSR